jgi:hypothetical protein
VKCGADAAKCFSELGTLSAYKEVAIVVEGAKFVAKETGRATLDDADDWESQGEYLCSECGNGGWKLGSLVRCPGDALVQMPISGQLNIYDSVGIIVKTEHRPSLMLSEEELGIGPALAPKAKPWWRFW